MFQAIRSWLVRKGWIKATLEDVLDLIELDPLMLDQQKTVEGTRWNFTGQNEYLAFTFRSDREDAVIQIRLTKTGDLWCLEYYSDSLLEIRVNDEQQARPIAIRTLARHIYREINSAVLIKKSVG